MMDRFDVMDVNRIQTERIAELEERLAQHEQGFQGACYACEPVGELNVKLESRITEIERQNKKLIDTLHDAKALLLFWIERNGYRANDFDNTLTMRDINKLLAGTDEET